MIFRLLLAPSFSPPLLTAIFFAEYTERTDAGENEQLLKKRYFNNDSFVHLALLSYGSQFVVLPAI
jgi:hypothetical protein